MAEPYGSGINRECKTPKFLISNFKYFHIFSYFKLAEVIRGVT